MDRISRLLNAKNGAGFFVLSLVLTFFVFVNLSLLGCGGGIMPSCGNSQYNYERDESEDPPVRVSLEIENEGIISPGSTVSLNLSGDWEGDSTGTLDWLPPDGVTNIQFHGIQPEPGGPPYIFKNITSQQAYDGIPVSYTIPDGYPDGKIIDDLTITSERGEVTSQLFQLVDSSASSPLIVQASQPIDQSVPDLTPAATRKIWKIMDFQDFSMTLDQQVCQDIVNQVKSPNFFTALRVPVADEIAYGQPYTLPLVRTTSNYPVMSLTNRMIYPDLNMPLELRQGASTWANLNLPSAPGMVWMAMGVKPDTVVSCPNIEDPEGFTMRTTLDLDLSGRPQGCANCKIEKYVCYKTGTGSLLEEASVGGGALGVGPASITVGDFTCLRAGETLLTRQSNWHLHNSINGLLLKPGEPIEIQYWVENDMETPLVLSLAPVSTLAGANLTIYPGQSGSPTLPDLAHPIVGSTITVPPLHDGTPGTFYLHIRGEVPENAAPEQYRYTLTLANSAANPTAWDGSTQIIVTEDGNLPGVAGLQPGVGLRGRALPALVRAGENLTYYLTVENTGAQTLTNLILTDTLPANTTFVSCAGGDTCQNNSGTITWSLAVLGAGQEHVVSLVVKVDVGMQPGGKIINGAYNVQTGQSVSATGDAIETQVGGPTLKVYLPLLSKR